MTDVFLYQGEPSPNDVRLRDPTTAAGAAGIAGDGALVDASSTTTGAGISRSTGTGALAAQASTASGLGSVTTASAVGTGTLLDQSSTASGAGSSSSTGTGTLTDNAATVIGVALSSSEGTGALTDQAATLAGAGITQWVARDGSFLLENGVDHYIQEAGGQFLREEIHLEAQPSAISGAGISSVTGTGALFAGASTVSGVGTVPEAIVGSGPRGVDDYYSAIPLLKRKIRKEQEQEEARQIAAAAQKVATDIAEQQAQEPKPAELDFSLVATPTTDLAEFAKARTEAQARQAELIAQDDEDAIIAILMAA